MRLHRSLLALIAVFALTNIGIATFIAAAPAHLATVTIASASDDLPTPPPTPVPATTPTPALIPSTGCVATLVVVPSMNQPTGTQIPGAMKEIGRFALNYSTPAGCPTQSTDSAVVREITVAFQWSELSAIARRRAVVTQLELRSLDRGILYGKYPSVRASGNTTIRFITRVPRLDIPLAGMKEFVIIGNTTNVTDGNTSIVTLQAHVKRVIAEITMSGDVIASSLMYDGAPVAQTATLTTGLDAASPTGIQTAGVQKEILRFWVTTAGGEATIQNLRLQFEAIRDDQAIRVPLRNVSISLQPEGSPRIGRWQVPVNGTLTIANIGRLSGSTVTAGQMKVIRVFADTTEAGTGLPMSLRASIIDLTARTTTTTGSIHPTATLPVQGNWLSY